MEIDKIIISLFIFFILPKIIIKYINKMKLDSRKRTILNLALNVIRYIALIFIIYFLINLLNIDKTALLATTSILGFIFGIGAQKLVQDMISGFFIIFEDHLRVDDYVLINDSMGEIVNVGLKTTTIKTWEGEYHAISNGDIVKIVNYSKYPSLAIVDVKISYDNDIEKVRYLIEEYINNYNYENKYMIGKPEFLGIQSSNDINLTIRVVANTISYEHFQVRRYLLEKIIDILKNNNIKIKGLD